MNQIIIQSVTELPPNYTGIALYRSTAEKEWYEDGVLHREDGPAVVGCYGKQEWWFKGKLHRMNGPAKITAFGDRFWFVHGIPTKSIRFGNSNPLSL